MYDKKIFKDLINSMRSAYKTLLSVHSDASFDSLITTWERISNQNVQCLNKFLKTPHLTVGEKLHILTTIAHLKSLSAKFNEQKYRRNCQRERHQCNIVGGNIGTVENHIQWDDTETAFNSRIKTGIIQIYST
ncbi:hypothetical protein PV328_011737 [Microctonus aethiopoides]|uniref:Uncharacterized protein n=1 Tax=Microctonus aethiopoides TaxID=144406 RepID=A0AA39ESQ4_9HYME|nr:hypothetical protein PV328_011737 [Microctonus aethiopoides]